MPRSINWAAVEDGTDRAKSLFCVISDWREVEPNNDLGGDAARI